MQVRSWLASCLLSPGGVAEHPSNETVDLAADPYLRLGGMALANGLVVVSARNWAAAIREDDGSISVASGKKPLLPGTGERELKTRAAALRSGRRGREGVPVLRGLGRFAESLMVLGSVKRRMPGARLPFESRKVAEALATSMIGVAAVRLVAPRSAVIQEVGSAVAAFVPAVLAIKNSPVSGYHGAEHKVIGAREEAIRAAGRRAAAGSASVGAQELAGLTGDAAAAPKEHDRCGSNLIGPFIVASVLANLLARDRLGRKTALRSAVAGAVSLGAALEILRWADRHPRSSLANLMMMPGRLVQEGLTTTEPTGAQLEVGEKALAELLRLEACKS